VNGEPSRLPNRPHEILQRRAPMACSIHPTA